MTQAHDIERQIDSPWLTRKEAAAYLRLLPTVLVRWATTKEGPKFRKFGGACRYHIDDLKAYAESQPVSWDDERVA